VQEGLVGLGKNRVAGFVGQKVLGGNDNCPHWLAQPPCKDLLIRQLSGEFQGLYCGKRRIISWRWDKKGRWKRQNSPTDTLGWCSIRVLRVSHHSHGSFSGLPARVRPPPSSDPLLGETMGILTQIEAKPRVLTASFSWLA